MILKALYLQIVLIGSATIRSTILVDSFRYIAPGTDVDRCIIYEEEVTTEEIEEITTEEPIDITTEEPEENTSEELENSSEEPDQGLETECVVYEFGTDFDIKFNRNGLCRFMLEWALIDTTTGSVENFHPNSKSHISAGSFPSCTSSFNFNMTGDGVIEVNIYMESSSLTADDHVDVIVYKTDKYDSSTIIEEAVYDPTHQNFLNSQWYKLEIPLRANFDTTSFTGYVCLIKSLLVFGIK